MFGISRIVKQRNNLARLEASRGRGRMRVETLTAQIELDVIVVGVSRPPRQIAYRGTHIQNIGVGAKRLAMKEDRIDICIEPDQKQRDSRSDSDYHEDQSRSGTINGHRLRVYRARSWLEQVGAFGRTARRHDRLMQEYFSCLMSYHTCRHTEVRRTVIE